MSEKSEILVKEDALLAGSYLRLVILAGVLGILGVTVYFDPLRQLAVNVLERQGSSHGVLVPFISAYLLWLNWDDIKDAAFRPALVLGLAFVFVGVAFLWVSWGGGGFRLASLSFFLLAAGLVALLFGGEVFRHSGFPILFLITMIPLPDATYAQLSEIMRSLTAWGSVGLLKFAGIPHYRDGFDLYFHNQQLHIAHGCSGIRYLLSYLVFGTAYAFRFKDTNAARAAVVAAAIPLAVIGGIIRLSAIFFTTHFVSPIFVTGKPHVLMSWAVFTGVLVFAVGFDQVLMRRSK